MNWSTFLDIVGVSLLVASFISSAVWSGMWVVDENTETVAKWTIAMYVIGTLCLALAGGLHG